MACATKLGHLERRTMAQNWGCVLNPWELRRQIISSWWEWDLSMDSKWFLRQCKTLKLQYKAKTKHVYIYIYVSMCIYICMYTCIYIYMYMYVYKYPVAI